ncbi:MAG: biotin transporter BioY [Candidatus Gastranaerophilales bacterium]|nr:biotin transporter BioY [Candidatus Gastranaerophilales bacterium]
MINKRYKDIFQQYIHKGEATPLTIGTLVVCALCFIILIIATFTQINFAHPWMKFIPHEGFIAFSKQVSYSPLLPAMIFIIYILGKSYSILTFICYLIVGFFVWPIFVFGGGLDYLQNYLFGYMLGVFFAIAIISYILKISRNFLYRTISAIFGVLSIHIFGFLYCIILAIFRVISFSLVIPILTEISLGNILYDIIFSIIVILIAPYIKNVLWTCMKPKMDRVKKTKIKEA